MLLEELAPAWLLPGNERSGRNVPATCRYRLFEYTFRSMFHLEQLYIFKIAAIVTVFLLSACDKDPVFIESNELVVSPEVSVHTTPATPEATGQHTSEVATQPPAEEPRSVESLKLTIEEDPFEEPSFTSFGTTTDADWLNNEGHSVELDNMPARDNLLPDLFNKKEHEKAASVKMDVLIEDDEQGVADVIDGAGMSIKYKTD